MKADKVRQFMLKKYPTKDYFDCPVPKHYWDVIQEYADNYARIQIEKDRERVKDAVHESGLYHNHIGLDKIYKNTPINLD